MWAFPEMPCHSRGDALRFCLLTEDEEEGGQDAEKLQLKSYSCQARNGGELLIFRMLEITKNFEKKSFLSEGKQMMKQ